MKRRTILLVAAAIVLMAAGGIITRSFLDTSGHEGEAAGSATAEVYTCPMHPSVRSDRPGACPVCGMALVRVSAAGEAPPAERENLRRVSLSSTQRVMANITTVEVGRHPLSHEIRAVGLVGFAEPLRAAVAARFRGRLEVLHVNFTGQEVKKGEPLFELYSPDLITAEREYLLARASSRHAEAADSADATVGDELLRSAIDRLRVHFGFTAEQIASLDSSGVVRTSAVFYSPISGTVIRGNVVQGDYVDEGTVLYELADLSRVWVLLDVYEQDIRFVRVGSDVRVQAEAYPGDEFHGKVVFVDPVLTSDTRTVRVRLEVANAGGRLKPNMYVNGTITVRTGSVLSVPRQAVLNTGQNSVVWVEVDSNSFEPRSVTTGMTDHAAVEILSGVEEGERVAATGGFLIDSESALSLPVPERGPAPEHHHGSHASAGEGPITITVDGGYTPDVIHVVAGRPVRLHFTRLDSSECTREVVFGSLGIRRELPTGKTTTIEFTPDKPGEILFECGMQMLEGKIVVSAPR